ncbi:hypothetical protein VIBNIAM115_1110028 [Vibrio nigripulchritudo AM115]|nr:hypothetical protein VIBNIAM115_1110028 [Vibrio nigripulchritudo AM115]
MIDLSEMAGFFDLDTEWMIVNRRSLNIIRRLINIIIIAFTKD